MKNMGKVRFQVVEAHFIILNYEIKKLKEKNTTSSIKLSQADRL